MSVFRFALRAYLRRLRCLHLPPWIDDGPLEGKQGSQVYRCHRCGKRMLVVI